jgi:hypothetical protein
LGGIAVGGRLNMALGIGTVKVATMYTTDSPREVSVETHTTPEPGCLNGVTGPKRRPILPPPADIDPSAESDLFKYDTGGNSGDSGNQKRNEHNNSNTEQAPEIDKRPSFFSNLISWIANR